MSDLVFVLGTRPEIIKLTPVIRECEDRGIPFEILHTGQHYSENLDETFFSQLRLPEPTWNLEVGSTSQGEQVGKMIIGIESILQESSPDVAIVQGDTNSVLAGAISTCKMPEVSTAHVEAGLRSYDMRMPEEINRRLTDHVSEFLFAPTEQAKDNLILENISPEKITVTGNTIVDAVYENLELARNNSGIFDELSVSDRFGLLTVHRAENVDHIRRFKSILEGVDQAARNNDLQIVYPIHPRSRKQIDEFGLSIPSSITLIDPVDFHDFLLLEDQATIIFTDSGGVQEEGCIIGTPCVTLRDNTERPETLSVNSNILAGVDPNDIARCTEEMLCRDEKWDNPFGDGKAAIQIIDVLEEVMD